MTYSDTKTRAVVDADEATRTRRTRFPYLEYSKHCIHYIPSPERIRREKEEKLRLCKQFIENRHTSK